MAIRTTAIINLKGGVAKTTTAINMAAILAKDHKARVLLIDADSQCNTTEFFAGNPDSGNVAAILRNAKHFDDPGSFAAAFIQKPVSSGNAAFGHLLSSIREATNGSGP